MIIPFKAKVPEIAASSFVAESADIIGDVVIGEHSSIWHQCVLRGDINLISVGTGSNIQDGSVLHNERDKPCIVGNYVTVGHQCVLHGCVIGDEVMIGMGAVILSGAQIPNHCIIGAHALVTEGAILEPGYLYLGVPARRARMLTQTEKDKLKAHALKYSALADEYRAEKNL